MKALIIEDSPDLVEAISLCLNMRWPGASIVPTALGSKGVELVETESPDIVILDIGLPDMEGFEVLREIRRFSSVPVIVVTVHNEDTDKIKGLELGADDYITKPFSHLELLARVKAVLRRAHMPELSGDEQLLEIGDVCIDLAARQIHQGEKIIKLTPIEYSILVNLVRNEGRVIPHRVLLQKVWGDEFSEELRYIKKYIHSLRDKLGDNAHNPRIIINERGIGYKFIRPT